MLRANIECVVFDFDGTLVDSNNIKRNSFFDTVEGVSGGAAIMERLLSAPDMGNRFDTFKRFVTAASLSVSRANEFAEAYGQQCKRLIVACDYIPGASQLLARLRADHIKIFINSATPVTALCQIVQLRNLTDKVDGLYGSPASKEANLLSILKKTSCQPQNTLVVGDGEDDRASAASVGCQFVGVGHQIEWQDTTTVTDLTDLLATPRAETANTTHAI